MSKYEMTQGQWLRLTGRNPSAYGPGFKRVGRKIDLTNPVEQVTWEDCDLWVRRLALILPTEAQWEYAARGGTTTPRWTGIGTDGLAKAVNLADAFFHGNGGPPSDPYESWDDGHTVHAPIGTFPANPFGLHEVLGNVWEWCRDRWSDYDEATARPGDGLRTPRRSGSRAFRGGCFLNLAEDVRSAIRWGNSPSHRESGVGVRPARVLDQDVPIVGRWEGTVTQQGPTNTTFPVTIVFATEQSGTVDYSSLKCGGTLTLENKTGNIYVYRERITRGQDACIDNGIMEIAVTNATTARWLWRHDKGDEQATATMTRSGK
jgi:hypothetical protein